MSPFDFVKEILHGKNNLIVDALTEKEYKPFLVNRSISYHRDCIFQANEMNRRPLADSKMQYDFLLGSIRSYKRPFHKWTNKDKISANIEAVKTAYGYSNEKSSKIIGLLSDKQLEQIRNVVSTGGLKK